MSGIFSIMSDKANGMFRLNQAKRAWDEDGKAGNLQEKLENGEQAFSLDPDFARGAHAAMTAMEEAKRIAGPKGAAEDRIAQAEKRLKEIRQEARLAAARGDREKLMALAREAALMARQAGRAAKEYGAGVSAAAVMGVGGDPTRTNGAGGGTGAMLATSSVSMQVSSTTLQVRQVEISVTLTIKGDGKGDAGSTDGAIPTGESAAPVGDDGWLPDNFTFDGFSNGVGAMDGAITDGGAADGGAIDGATVSAVAPDGRSGDDLLAALGVNSQIRLDGLAERVGAGLSATGQAIGGFNGPEGKRLLAAMIQDNEMKASRYREADGFARRVETALHDAKTVIGEAKAANRNDPDADRRAERRKELKEMDKEVDAGFEATADLRAAAFGGSADVAALAAAGTGGDAGSAAAPTVVSVATPVAIAAPSVNITA